VCGGHATFLGGETVRQFFIWFCCSSNRIDHSEDGNLILPVLLHLARVQLFCTLCYEPADELLSMLQIARSIK
jgi:hypothetical protein